MRKNALRIAVRNAFFVTSRPIQQQNVPLGQPAYFFKGELAVQINPPDAIKGDLSFHAKEVHFQKELSAAQGIVAVLDEFLSDCLAAAGN